MGRQIDYHNRRKAPKHLFKRKKVFTVDRKKDKPIVLKHEKWFHLKEQIERPVYDWYVKYVWNAPIPDKCKNYWVKKKGLPGFRSYTIYDKYGKTKGRRYY